MIYSRSMENPTFSDLLSLLTSPPPLSIFPLSSVFFPHLSLSLYSGKRFVCKIFPIINQGCAREEGDFSINLTTKDRQNRTDTCFRILFEGGSTGQQHLPAQLPLYPLLCEELELPLSLTEQTNAKP